MVEPDTQHHVAEPKVLNKISKADAAKAPPAAMQEEQRPARVAVFVTHGMGQQAPFETLDLIAQGLITAAGGVTTKVVARTVRSDALDLQRLEFGIRDQNGRNEEIHVYEAYWAPLTEGQVSLKDVTRFLFSAGWNGIANSLDDFKRWMFDRSVNFGLHVRTSLQLLAALGVVIALGVMNSLIATVAAARIFVHNDPKRWPGEELLWELNTVMAGFLAVSIVCGLALWLALKLRPKKPGESVLWRGITALLQLLFWAWIAITILSGIAFIAALAADQYGRDLSWLLVCPTFKKVDWLWMWALLIGVSSVVRQLLIQYLGDVDAYVSSHTLDRFNQLRQAIKKIVYERARAVYSAGDQNGKYIYDRVAIVGHSLGSAIVYDTLNALLNDDIQAQNTPNDPKALMLAVADRTKLLLTFGSPLDKVAFLFARNKATDHQRALATTVQPLIQDYVRFRKTKWINIYASRDIISGRLRFFDDPDLPTTTTGKIESLEDPDALIPVVAHIEYWQNPTLFGKLYANL